MANLRIDELLIEAVNLKASDLHLTTGLPPMVRVGGSLRALDEQPMLRPADTREMMYSIMTPDIRDRYEEEGEVDFSHGIPGVARFRVNAYTQRGSVGGAFRVIPTKLRSLAELGLPPVVKSFAEKTRGIVLVTGPTGSGKSTTLASMIDIINSERACHVITLEDPIEYLHKHKRSMINQREVGSDTKSFAAALRAALREDPDVILVGEMRDLETTSIALTAAETGHLVLATLHTNDTVQTVDRIIDQYPPHQQQQVRVQFASALQGIISQILLPRLDGQGRVVAVEILVATPAVRNLIREGKTHQIYSVLQTGAKHGMKSLDMYLVDLARSGMITWDDAFTHATNPEEIRRLGRFNQSTMTL
ncbi:MAG: type IV pilus twitching motility protein PilT [Firmicutes bacterium]|nr:type IV pilus twitching motility protein PilT [Bacillota bacterium]